MNYLFNEIKTLLSTERYGLKCQALAKNKKNHYPIPVVEFQTEELMQLNRYVWISRVLISAVDLDIFSRVGDTGATLEELVKSTGASERGMRMLLNVLIPLGFLSRDNAGKYSLTDFSKMTAVPDSPGYIIPRIQHLKRLWEAWGDLTESVVTGKSYWMRHPGPSDFSNLVQLAEGLFPVNLQVATTAAEALGVGKAWKNLNILDVAAGSGAWSIAFLKADPGSKATAIDFAPVLEMAQRKAAAQGVDEQFSLTGGNLREIDFGSAVYDLVILGHICHSEGPSHCGKLISKSAKALKAGGKLLIADMIPENDRRSSLHPLLFALNMLVNTPEGDTFTLEEYSRWCGEAGLVNTRLLSLPVKQHSPLVIADKPV